MKGFREPVGEHPADVYWRRRIVLAVALVVIVLVGRLIWSAVASGAEPTDGASPDATVTSSADAAPADDASAQPTADDAETSADEAEPVSSTSASPEPDKIGPCTQDDLEVSVGSEPRVGNETVAFEVTVTQVGEGSCVVDAGADGSSLLVTSGDVRIWSSTDCDATATLADTEWLLATGSSKTFDVRWPIAWSSEGCGKPSETAPQPGTYWAQLTFQGQTPDRVAFELS